MNRAVPLALAPLALALLALALMLATACKETDEPASPWATFEDDGVRVEYPRAWTVIPASAMPEAGNDWKGALLNGNEVTATLSWYDGAGAFDTMAEASRTSELLVESLRRTAREHGADDAVAEDSAHLTGPMKTQRTVGKRALAGARYIVRMQGALANGEATWEIYDVTVGTKHVLLTLKFPGAGGELPLPLQHVVSTLGEGS
jgi:hypothetical protein